jgi:hypothetical protein
MPPEGAQLLRLFAKDVTLSAVSWMQWLCVFMHYFINYLQYVV